MDRLNRWLGKAAIDSPPPPSRSTLQLIFDPPLPTLLSPLPSLFRLISFLIIAPIVFVCVIDFVGYAIFRTLGECDTRRKWATDQIRSAHLALLFSGFNRQRVRVKTKVRSQRLQPPPGIKRKESTLPVLTPGAYDADTLLRHRERSASAASAEALEEWARTGGQFARVSSVLAKKSAAASTAGAAGPTSGTTLNVPDLLSPPDSPRSTFGRMEGVGVEGALGYFDTDAEDSGVESGQNSPEIGRRGSRKGLSGSALGFTPVSPEMHPSAKKALGLHVPTVTTSYSADSDDRSPKSTDSATSSWIRLEESSAPDEEGAAIAEAAAADLEPSTVVV